MISEVTKLRRTSVGSGSRKFGELTVIGKGYIKKDGKASRRYLKVKCKCGTICFKRKDCLVAGKIKHCGCKLYRERDNHGLSKHPLFSTYNGMMNRCYNPTLERSEWYLGRGISVCEQWRGKGGFVNFLNDMGPSYKPGLTIDRIDNNGNYDPDNCRWITLKEQQRNTSRTRWVTYNNKKVSFATFCEDNALYYPKAYSQLVRGRTPEQIIAINIHKVI